ncbi:MAG: helix-turn-helix domain-containing protein [Kordiimonas sp.]
MKWPAEALRKFRETTNFSQRELAKQLSVSTRQVQRWEQDGAPHVVELACQTIDPGDRILSELSDTSHAIRARLGQSIQTLQDLNLGTMSLTRIADRMGLSSFEPLNDFVSGVAFPDKALMSKYCAVHGINFDWLWHQEGNRIFGNFNDDIMSACSILGWLMEEQDFYLTLPTFPVPPTVPTEWIQRIDFVRCTNEEYRGVLCVLYIDQFIRPVLNLSRFHFSAANGNSGARSLLEFYGVLDFIKSNFHSLGQTLQGYELEVDEFDALANGTLHPSKALKQSPSDWADAFRCKAIDNYGRSRDKNYLSAVTTLKTMLMDQKEPERLQQDLTKSVIEMSKDLKEDHRFHFMHKVLSYDMENNLS